MSRVMPGEVHWLIKPLTDDLPRNMMSGILDETRAVYSDPSLANKLATFEAIHFCQRGSPGEATIEMWVGTFYIRP